MPLRNKHIEVIKKIKKTYRQSWSLRAITSLHVLLGMLDYTWSDWWVFEIDGNGANACLRHGRLRCTFDPLQLWLHPTLYDAFPCTSNYKDGCCRRVVLLHYGSNQNMNTDHSTMDDTHRPLKLRKTSCFITEQINSAFIRFIKSL